MSKTFRLLLLKIGRRKICCFLTVAAIFVVLVLKNGFETFGEPNGSPDLSQDERSTTVDQLETVIIERGSSGKRNGPEYLLAKSQECKLPNLEVQDPTLAKYFHPVPPLVCAGAEPNWVVVKNGKIILTPEAERNHGRVSCRFTGWLWKNDMDFSEFLYDSGGADFNGTRVKSDFLHARCRSTDGAKFENFYSTVVPNRAAISRAANAAEKWTSGGPEVNVYVWAIESMSRVHVIRKLPKTYEFIRSLNPVIFEGYNIVGDGTPQALIPILTGRTEEELPLTRKRFSKANFVDVYPWIWNSYRDAGYVTLYGEDAYEYGTFTYRLRGFKVQPTDHYMRTFYMKVEPKFSHFDKFCIAGESQHKVFFRTSQDFFNNYPESVKKFAFMFYGARLSHEDLNSIEIADSEFAEHLKSLQDSGVLNNTVLFMVADHGHRFAKLRQTHQGQLEERLPFFGIAAPEWFRKKYAGAWENLKNNSRKLVTPFDVHETLKVLLEWREPTIGKTNQRANSLFDQIPKDRSCQQAGIDPHWCVCLQWTEESVKNALVRSLAQKIVDVINRQTERERKLCSPLRLSRIESAKRLAPHKDLLRYKTVKDLDGYVPDLSGKTRVAFAHYQIKFRTTPGDALYEATVECDMRVGPGKVFVDLDTVSHINQYGDKPHCVIDKDYFLAKWCVCYDKV